MKRVTVTVCAFLIASLCRAQTPTASTVHGAFPVKVSKTIDSSKLRENDSIEVETSGSFKLADGTMVPKGSRLMGRVLIAKARSKGDPVSELNIVFGKLSLAEGNQLAVKGIIQAVFPSSEESDLGANAMPTTAAGGSVGGGGGGNVGIVGGKPGSNMDSTGNPQLVADPKSTGVHGIKDLDLDNGVLTSKSKQVKLGSGVRMIIHVDISG